MAPSSPSLAVQDRKHHVEVDRPVAAVLLNEQSVVGSVGRQDCRVAVTALPIGVWALAELPLTACGDSEVVRVVLGQIQVSRDLLRGFH